MAAFIDLEYYVNTYKGAAVPADSFYRYAERASTAVDFHTFERASATITANEDEALIDKIKMATCAAADALYNADSQANGGSIASEKVGDYSVNYAVSPDTALTVNAKVSNAMREYLAFTGLLFRGMD